MKKSTLLLHFRHFWKSSPYVTWCRKISSFDLLSTSKHQDARSSRASGFVFLFFLTAACEQGVKVTQVAVWKFKSSSRNPAVSLPAALKWHWQNVGRGVERRGAAGRDNNDVLDESFQHNYREENGSVWLPSLGCREREREQDGWLQGWKTGNCLVVMASQK